MSKPLPVFPDKTLIRLPAGVLERVHQKAARQGTTAAEVLRQAVCRDVGVPAADEQECAA